MKLILKKRFSVVAILAVVALTPCIATAANPFIHGYPGKRSYVAGEEVTFHLSTNVGRVDVEIARIGAERKLVWSKKGIAAGEHPVPKHASSHGCDWPTAFSVKIPKSWPSGYYEAWTRSGNTQGNRTFFVVRSSQPGRDARILLQLSINTYNAYSNWGGFSLYTYWGPAHWNKKHELGDVLGRRVTFQRPLYRDDFRRWELPFIQWAERNGYKIDYAINSDLENLRHFYDRGVRYLTLTHTASSDWCISSADTAEEFHGLTDFGKEVVREMNRLGMIVDLSHASVSAVEEALKVTTDPVIASRPVLTPPP